MSCPRCASPKSFSIRVNRGCIGRMAVIVFQGSCYLAEVIDQVAGTNRPKRVRVEYNPNLQGRVLMLGQYAFKQWADADEE